MGLTLELAVGVCLVVLVGGLVNWGNLYLRKRSEPRPDGVAGAIGLEARLDEIERRLTDIQDVMIALSEKFDRWESDRAEDPGRERGRGETPCGTPGAASP
ncbi:MAG: hypothetical protein AB1505_06345 [Candidatus Latescibacterota bacterium]